jgi:RNA polymerase sigma factor (sigma-70 family)
MPPTVEADEMGELIKLAMRASAGDDVAARQLLRSVRPAMTRTIAAVLGSKHPEVEDVAQESMIGFLRALAAFRGDCHPAGYASRIALHTALRTRRRAKLERERSDKLARLSPPETSSLPSEEAAGERCRSVMRDLLEDLPSEQAEALALRVVLGWSLEEVALATGAPVNTVRSRVRLAKEALRRRIEASPHLIDDLGVGP